MDFKPYPHQVEASKEVFSMLKSLGYCYLFGKPRSGKTLTAILTSEQSTSNLKVLVLTKKNAIDGWYKFINKNLKHSYKVINYEQLGSVVYYNQKDEKVTKSTIKKGDKVKTKIVLKENPKDYFLVIVDESHNYGVVGKPTSRYKVLKAFAKDLPHLHISGTPYIETANSMYHQMAISKYNPFSEFKTFYKFFAHYGIPKTKYIGTIQVNDYTHYKKELLGVIDSFTIRLGGLKNVEATDKVVYVQPDDRTVAIYNKLLRDKIAKVRSDNGTPMTIVCDTIMSLRMTLHQIEGGRFENAEGVLTIANNAKIRWIQDNIITKLVKGENLKIGIMSHFRAEQQMLKELLPMCEIYSSNAHAEGVDLSHLDYFIIYSQDYSGAKHIQRRDRIVNLEGSKTLEVIHLLVKGGISEQVYKVTSKKLNFNNKVFKKVRI